MKLRNEHLKSYVDDTKDINLLKFLTWKGRDVAFAWIGPHEPATRSDDFELQTLAECNRVHYMFYRALVERHMDNEGDVLDVGCGSGQRTAMLGRYSKSVVGIDADISKIGVGSELNGGKNLSWLFGEFVDWAKSDGQGATFDYVFAIEVIEHVEPKLQGAFLQSLLEKTNKGGALIMTTPRDKNPNRIHPHIGLWDDDIALKLSGEIGGSVEYFNANALKSGGDNPWSTMESSTHYVISVKP